MLKEAKDVLTVEVSCSRAQEPQTRLKPTLCVQMDVVVTRSEDTILWIAVYGGLRF